MKILIAGGAGFIGSTIASLLSDHGHETVIVDNLSTGRIEFTRSHAFYHGDICDGPLIDKVFTEHPDIVATINCAALIVVPDSVTYAQQYYENNVAQGITFLGHLMRNGCTKYIFSATGSVYDLVEGFEVDESAPLRPLSPYSRTKMFFEGALADIAAAGQMQAISLRYFNPIGADPKLRSGLQIPEPSHALGKIIQADATGGTFTVTGVDWPTRDGSGIRDYIHVWDLARAHLLAVEKFSQILASEPYHVINLGTGVGTTVKELIVAYEKVTGHKIHVSEGPARPGDFPGSFASGKKAWELLGWNTELSLEQGIEDTLRWFSIRDKKLHLSPRNEKAQDG